MFAGLSLKRHVEGAENYGYTGKWGCILMTRNICVSLLACLVVSLFHSCSFRSITETAETHPISLAGYGSLANFPFKEAWYGMYFHEEKVGYSHFKIQPNESNFIISTESMIKLSSPKKTDEIEMKEKIFVKPDLTLISFDSVVDMNGKRMNMAGQSEGRQLTVEIRLEGETIKRNYPIEGDLFHASAISLLPALKGLKDGGTNSFRLFNAEKQATQRVNQHIFLVSGKPGPNGAVWKVKNQYGPSLVYSWLDKKGLTVIEKAFSGSLITLIEDETSARKFKERRRSFYPPPLGCPLFGFVHAGKATILASCPWWFKEARNTQWECSQGFQSKIMGH